MLHRIPAPFQPTWNRPGHFSRFIFPTLSNPHMRVECLGTP